MDFEIDFYARGGGGGGGGREEVKREGHVSAELEPAQIIRALQNSNVGDPADRWLNSNASLIVPLESSSSVVDSSESLAHPRTPRDTSSSSSLDPRPPRPPPPRIRQAHIETSSESEREGDS